MSRSNSMQEPPSEENVRQAEAARDAVRQKAAAIEDAQLGQRLRVGPDPWAIFSHCLAAGNMWG